ncbi:ras-related protein Rab-33A isoform X1 [Ailuropoda melanoleuca]|uniref:RAB33A, member RAS onco family n=1 Tax=Ailuropoda melanoleuca TaxID=9646 RepID=A0A7N5JPB1_AILME|nr:ras-related protein Rab-33A isoform X1 [Ailuropoda melanoleuca]
MTSRAQGLQGAAKNWTETRGIPNHRPTSSPKLNPCPSPRLSPGSRLHPSPSPSLPLFRRCILGLRGARLESGCSGKPTPNARDATQSFHSTARGSRAPSPERKDGPSATIPLLKVQVWDTAGQERFRKSMVEHYYRNVHAVVFVYDVTKMTSFTNLKMWIQECNGHAVPPLVPKVLVGNKCDLREQIQVPSNLALKFADAHNMLLFETSAKDPKESQNVESIFMCLACRLKAQKSLLYRDAERQHGKVQKLEFPQEANSKTSCPC